MAQSELAEYLKGKIRIEETTKYILHKEFSNMTTDASDLSDEHQTSRELAQGSADEAELHRQSLTELMEYLNILFDGKIPNKVATRLLKWRNKYVEELASLHQPKGEKE